MPHSTVRKNAPDASIPQQHNRRHGKQHRQCRDVDGNDRDFWILLYEISAVNHMGTARIQRVREESNTLYYNLIKKFFEVTGIPMLLNTSFNIRGEPIVNSPGDAINTFKKSGIDTLVLGNFIVDKK